MKKRLVIIENEYTIALDIQTHLTKLGYDIVGMGESFSDALSLVASEDPDAVIMDIQITGTQTGVDAAKVIQESFGVPVIFLTAYTDSGTFEEALDIKPYGYLHKPFKPVELKNTVEVAISNHSAFQKQKLELTLLKEGLQNLEKKEAHSDSIFIKDKGQLIHVPISSIFRLEAMDNYTLIHTETERYVVGQFLKDVHKRLPEADFFRVHRSHVLRIDKITSIDGNFAFIQNRGIPISKQFRTAFIDRLTIL